MLNSTIWIGRIGRLGLIMASKRPLRLRNRRAASTHRRSVRWNLEQRASGLRLDNRRQQGQCDQFDRATIHKDDQVFQMVALGELKGDGKIYCTDGKTSWVLERKP